MEAYEVEIIKEARYTYITIPFNAKEVFHKPKGTIYVKGSINDIDYRSKLISKGDGIQIMMIDKKLQKALGLGDANKKVQLTINEDNIIAENLETPKLIEASELDVIAAISTRRSIRAYTNQPISDEQLNTILNAGFCAPSAKNKRPWHFIVVRDKEQLTELSKTNVYTKMLPNCDCCIIVCGDKVLQGIKELLIADCSASTQNILLAAHGLGLGAVWCGVILNSDWSKQITAQFKLPKSIIPISVIALGHPNETRPIPDRFDAAKIHKELW